MISGKFQSNRDLIYAYEYSSGENSMVGTSLVLFGVCETRPWDLKAEVKQEASVSEHNKLWHLGWWVWEEEGFREYMRYHQRSFFLLRLAKHLTSWRDGIARPQGNEGKLAHPALIVALRSFMDKHRDRFTPDDSSLILTRFGFMMVENKGYMACELEMDVELYWTK